MPPGTKQSQYTDLNSIENHPAKERYTDLSPDEIEADLPRLLVKLNRQSTCNSLHLKINEDGISGPYRCIFPDELTSHRQLKHLGWNQWKFIPRWNDPLLNNFNEFVTRAWRANTHFTPVIFANDLIDYITKPPLNTEIIILEQILSESNEWYNETSIVAKIKCILESTRGEMIVPRLESIHFLLGFKLYSANNQVYLQHYALLKFVRICNVT